MDRCHYGVQGHSSCFASTSAKEPRTEATVLNESESDGGGRESGDVGRGRKLKEEVQEDETKGGAPGRERRSWRMRVRGGTGRERVLSPLVA